MILKVLIIFDPKLNLFKSDTYIFMQQSRSISTATRLNVITFKPAITRTLIKKP